MAMEEAVTEANEAKEFHNGFCEVCQKDGRVLFLRELHQGLPRGMHRKVRGSSNTRDSGPLGVSCMCPRARGASPGLQKTTARRGTDGRPDDEATERMQEDCFGALCATETELSSRRLTMSRPSLQDPRSGEFRTRRRRLRE